MLLSKILFHRFQLTAPSAWVPLGMALLTACGSGGGSDAPGASSPTAMPSVSPTGTPGPSTTGTAVVPPPPVIDCNAGPQPGSSPIRRLTPFEYDNTIRDLTKDAAYPGAQLPVEGGAGYDNNAEVGAVSRITAQKYMEAAEAVSARATANLTALLGCDPAGGETACVQAWIKSFGDRAWRRPLDATDTKQMGELFAAVRTTLTLEQSVQAVLEAFLESPHFLYRVEVGAMGAAVKVTDYQLASRLSYLLWGSMPDQTLLDAAAQGQLAQPDLVASQARRMLADPRTRTMAHRFHEQWWNYKDIATIEKDPATYPDFSPATNALYIEEVNRFLDYAIFEGDGSLSTLLTSPRTFVNPSLAAFYGVPAPVGTEFSPLDEPGKRAGLLTQGAFLATHAKANQTSIVARGVFVRGGLFCQVPPPPPDAVNVQLPPLQQGLSTRARLEQHRTDPVCNACHAQFDPLGFAFEHFDAVGRYRDQDSGVPVDAKGALTGTDVDAPFDGISELAKLAAQSDLVGSCAVTQWFRYGYGRQDSAADVCTLNQLNTAFKSSGYKIPELLVALTQSDAFLYRNTTTGAQQ
ncbi:MAG: DUF1592 domain-containing protein [Polyangiaceae bacterium]|nr:DUF1592 domain-containing protein [Polyangiaceae bacterium]